MSETCEMANKATRTTRVDSPGFCLAGQKLHNVAYVVRPRQYFVLKHLRSESRGRDERGWSHVRQTFKGCGGGEEIVTNTGVHGGRRRLDIVREPE